MEKEVEYMFFLKITYFFGQIAKNTFYGMVHVEGGL